MHVAINIDTADQTAAFQSPPVARNGPIIGGIVQGSIATGLPIILKYISK